MISTVSSCPGMGSPVTIKPSIDGQRATWVPSYALSSESEGPVVHAQASTNRREHLIATSIQDGPHQALARSPDALDLSPILEPARRP